MPGACRISGDKCTPGRGFAPDASTHGARLCRVESVFAPRFPYRPPVNETLRRLLILVLLVAALAGLEAVTTVDVPGFNLDEDDAAFDGLRRVGYRAVLDDQPTSLRRSRRSGPDGHLASEYDNIW